MQTRHYNRPKVVFIGLDGATWDIINQMDKERDLPNISLLIKNGSYGVCQAFKPLLSPILWTSISTGKLPDKHGVKNFYATSDTVKCKRIWEILADHGASVGLFGHFLTWPPKKVNGFVVPDLTARGPETYPPGLGFLFQLTLQTREERRIKLSDYINYLFLFLKFGGSVRTLLLAAKLTLKKLYGGTDERWNSFWIRVLKQRLQTDIFIHLYKKYRPDYCYYHIHLIDACSHNFWKYLEPEFFPDVSKRHIEKYKNVIFEAYKKADDTIGKILRGVDDKSIVILASDHGFGAASKESKAFRRIKFEVLLKILNLEKGARGINLGRRAIIAVLDSANEGTIVDALEHIAIEENGSKLFRVERLGYNNVSVAINPHIDELRLNENYHMVYNGIKCKLRDIIVKMPDKQSGTHHPNGILIISGPNVKKHLSLPHVRNVDIVPTLLVLSNLPVGRDMDGQVITDLIEDRYLKVFSVRYINSYDHGLDDTQDELMEEPGLDTLKEQLKSLGYL